MEISEKALLKGFTLNQSINDIFNDKPTYVIEKPL